MRRLTVTQFQRRLLQLVPELQQAVVRGLRDGALRMVGMTVENIRQVAVDSGELASSVAYVPLDDGAQVEVRAPHAPMIEYGTRPFSPPIAPLAEWAVRKGLAEDAEEAERIAWAIRAVFQRHGMAPRGYFARAWAEVQPALRASVARALRRVRP